MCDLHAKENATNSERIVGPAGTATDKAWPLFDVAHTRQLEAKQPVSPDGMRLMHTAGLALAKFTLAVTPHAKVIWIACGPGNNGGDGLIAATHLRQWGKEPIVTIAHDPGKSPPDAQDAWQRAQTAGVQCQQEMPAQFDVGIDALFGIGTLRPISSTYENWVERLNDAAAHTIAVDLPSGLEADTGTTAKIHVRADYTLSLLTLKPGLFTAHGRDAGGEIWFNDLGVNPHFAPQAWLGAPPMLSLRTHASHKGSYGDVAIVGGAAGMTGAAWLAGSSALHAGAGRIFVCLLDPQVQSPTPDMPELMVRTIGDMDWSTKAVVAGCGGGDAIAEVLPKLMREARTLVLDADALNQLALHPEWTEWLTQRSSGTTAMTPHPLEAARLLGITVSEVQANRLKAAQLLAERYQCAVALKGSGTVIAFPGELATINPTGNARLASAGTGDVLAGMVGAYFAQGLDASQATRAAVYRHGLAADRWQGPVLHASELCRRI